VVTLAPFGRGYHGSTAAAHDLHAKVSYKPRYPRAAVTRAINDVIGSVGNDLFAVGTTTFTMGAESTYALPAATDHILLASWDTFGGSDSWQPIRRYRLDFTANATDFPTGKTVDILDGVPIGRTVQVVYSKQPTLFTAASEVFATQTGLPATAKDVIVLGACARLVGYLDVSRMAPTSAETDLLDNTAMGQQAGTAASIGRGFYQMHIQRMAQERARLLAQYPVRMHFTR
jgi:hypothetical protein